MKQPELYELAIDQKGYFTTQQAKLVGFSSLSLHHYVQREIFFPIQYGIYRFAQFPPSEDEDLMVVWLWSKKEGVFSHETALLKHQLSDVLPSKIHITLPLHHSKRRKKPKGIRVYFDDISKKDIEWHGDIPITKAKKTILDLSNQSADCNIIEQAITNGVKQNLFRLTDVLDALNYLYQNLKIKS